MSININIEMDAEEAIKILERRKKYLGNKIENSNGSEAALIFDQREQAAIQFAIEQLEFECLIETMTG